MAVIVTVLRPSAALRRGKLESWIPC